MVSPFPGMDPYLEQFWNDVHGALMPYIRDELNEILPPQYRASMNARVVIDDFEGSTKLLTREPDVAVIDWPVAGKATSSGPATYSRNYLIQAPQIIQYEPTSSTEYFLEITEPAFSEKVITAIEVLSPTNKRPGDGMTQFKKKQLMYRAGGVNRIEIDLLRAGTRVFNFPSMTLGQNQWKPYYIATYWGHRPKEAGIRAIDLRDPLPVIGIPLRPADPEVPIALQPLMDRVYRNGRFPIDYSKPPDPPLDGADADWAREMLAKSAG